VGFVVDKVTLEQVFSEYFSFSCKFSFHRLLHIYHHVSSGAGKIGKTVADVTSGHGLAPPQVTRNWDYNMVGKTSDKPSLPLGLL
jgi:hypothetical protein